MMTCKNLGIVASLLAVTLTFLAACTLPAGTFQPPLATASTLAQTTPTPAPVPGAATPSIVRVASPTSTLAQATRAPTALSGAAVSPTSRVASPTSTLAQATRTPMSALGTTASPTVSALSLASAAQIKPLATVGDGVTSAIAWSHDGRLLIVGGSLGISVYEADTLQAVRYIDTGAWVRSLALSPDGRTLAAGPGDKYNLPTQSTITLWNMDTGQKLRALDAGQAGIVVAFAPDGRTLATVGQDVVRLWDVAAGRLARDFNRSWWHIILSPDLRRALVDEAGGLTTLWNLETDAPLFVEERSINGAASSPDSGKMAISVDIADLVADTIKVLDANTGQLLRVLEGPSNGRLAFSPDGHKLAAGGSNNIVQVWDVSAGQLIHTLDKQKYPFSLAFSPDGQALAIGSQKDQSLKLWDMRTGQELRAFRVGWGHDAVSFSPSGHVLAAQDGAAFQLWNVAQGQFLQAFEKSLAEEVTFTPDGRLFMVGSGKTRVWQWDQAAGQFRSSSNLPGSGSTPSGPHPVAISPDGQMLALVRDRDIQLVEARTGRLLHTLQGHTGPVLSLMFSPDGAILASTGDLPLPLPHSGPSRNGDIRLWDVKTGHLLSARETYPWWVFIKAFPAPQIVLTIRVQPDSCARGSQGNVATYSTNSLLSSQGDVSPLWSSTAWKSVGNLRQSLHGNLVAAVFQSVACSHEGPIQVWDVQTGETFLKVSLGNRAATDRPIFVTGLALNSEGSAVAIGGDDGSLGIWNINTGQISHSLRGLTANAASLLYSLDGRWLISGNADGKMQLWDANTGQLAQSVSGHAASVTGLLSSADGRLIVSSSDDGTARLWDIGPHSPPPPPTPFASSYHAIALDSIANADSNFQAPPTGRVSLGGIPFELSARVFKSQAVPAPHDAYPTIAKLSVDAPNAYRLHLLLNTGNGFTRSSGKTVCEVTVTCDGARSVIAQLKLGQDVREWNSSSGDVVSAAPPNARLAWSGPVAGGQATGYIDLLSLDLPAACQQGNLSLVEIADTSADTVGSLDPALNLTGVTVEGRLPAR